MAKRKLTTLIPPPGYNTHRSTVKKNFDGKTLVQIRDLRTLVAVYNNSTHAQLNKINFTLGIVEGKTLPQSDLAYIAMNEVRISGLTLNKFLFSYFMSAIEIQNSASWTEIVQLCEAML